MNSVMLCWMDWYTNKQQHHYAGIDFQAKIQSKVDAIKDSLSEEERNTCVVTMLDMDTTQIMHIVIMVKILYHATLSGELSPEMYNKCYTRITKILSVHREKDQNKDNEIWHMRKRIVALQKEIDMCLL